MLKVKYKPKLDIIYVQGQKQDLLFTHNILNYKISIFYMRYL